MKFDKKRLYPIVLILLMFIVYKYRETQNKQLQVIEGETMGTTYHIKYLGKENLKEVIDSLLKEVNLSMSTYIPESEISTFNKLGHLNFKSNYFYPVINKSKEIYNNTNGAFDPTIMPLVNAWGFGFDNASVIDSLAIDSILTFVSFDHLSFDNKHVISNKKGVMLDFSAIAKGYGVDVISNYLQSENINNHMVEIGGEVKCSGINQKEEVWNIGIDNPKFQEEGGDRLTKVIQLKNVALATSGNYRNFYTDENGIKRAHTINPKIGYPVEHSLLSASVKAKDCMSADGYATALMVLGVEKSKEVVMSVNDIEAFLIFDNNGKLETWNSKGFFNEGLPIKRPNK